MATPRTLDRFRLERYLAERHRGHAEFSLDGICEVDGEPVSFVVDRQSGLELGDGLWLPNWRERLECPRCRLNCRQRAMLALTLRAIAGRDGADPAVVYAMEQITPLFAALSSRAERARCIGSEYLGEAIRGGELVDQVRHEDVERLSFDDDSLDVVCSNDVLEHVALPRRALSEVARVLKPAGQFLFTIPFDTSRDVSRARAVRHKGGIDHRLPPEYHGDPLTGRALVYTDFGWDVLDWCLEAGFRRCAALPYWNLELGYLGCGQLLFRAEA